MNELNDIAIRLAKRIEGAVVRDFVSRVSYLGSDKSDSVIESPPSFYNLRRCILEELEQIIGVMDVEEKSSDYMIAEMSAETLKHHKESLRQRQAYQIAEALMNDSDVGDKFEFSTENKDGWAAYRSVRTSIAFIKLAKIRGEK